MVKRIWEICDFYCSHVCVKSEKKDCLRLCRTQKKIHLDKTISTYVMATDTDHNPSLIIIPITSLLLMLHRICSPCIIFTYTVKVPTTLIQ